MENEGLFKKEFLEQMARLKINDVARIPRYYRAVSNLPREALIEITDDFLDSSKYTPLPKDFLAAAVEWRKRYFLEHGHYYGKTVAESTEDKIDCNYCFDSGIVKIKHTVPDNFQKLIRCDCRVGSKCTAKLPSWAADLNGAFVRIDIDPSWFNPHTNETDNDKSAEKKIWDKVREWQKIVKKSEIYWKEIGYQS